MSLPTPHEIELQLRTLQREASPHEARTSLFNLVVFLQDREDEDLTEALNYLHGKRPARVIVVRRGCKGETSIDVTARCVEDREERGICIQEIVVFSGEDKAGEDPGAWGPLLIREIPTYLWWLDRLHTPREVFAQAEDLADRIIIDTDRVQDPAVFFQDALAQNIPQKVEIADLSWNRITQIQKLTAQLFNPWDLRPKLHNLSRIRFTGGLKSDVLLFFLWMKSKMEWEGSLAGPGPWKLKGPQGEVSLEHKGAGSLSQGFRIEFETLQKELFSFVDEAKGFATLNAPGEESYTAVFHLPLAGDMLLKEVDRTNTDRLFLEAMQACGA